MLSKFTLLYQVYIAIEGFEESLGFDPNDPIVPFLLLVGSSATLWYECPFLFRYVLISFLFLFSFVRKIY